MRKKGVSEIVSTIMLVALVIGAIAIVWAVAHNLVNRNLEKSGSCLDAFGKIDIYDTYTCYNSSSTELYFNIRIGEIDIKEVLFVVTANKESKSVRITEDGVTIEGLKIYPNNPDVKLPDKNSGKTYILNLTALNFPTPISKVDLIELVPIIKERECSVAASRNKIEICMPF